MAEQIIDKAIHREKYSYLVSDKETQWTKMNGEAI
jgi:hypothetical protein